MTEAAARPFEARYSLLKMSGWALLAAPLVAGSTGMLLRGLEHGSVFGAVIGGLGLAIFGGAMLAFLGCAADRRVQLRIDDQGLYLRAHADQPTPLRSIRTTELATGMVRILLQRPAKYPIKRRLRQFVYRINGGTARGYFGDVWIWTAHYGCTPGQIYAAMDAHTVPTAFERDLAARIKVRRE